MNPPIYKIIDTAGQWTPVLVTLSHRECYPEINTPDVYIKEEVSEKIGQLKSLLNVTT